AVARARGGGGEPRRLAPGAHQPGDAVGAGVNRRETGDGRPEAADEGIRQPGADQAALPFSSRLLSPVSRLLEQTGPTARNLSRHPIRTALALAGIMVTTAMLLDMVLLAG